MANYLRLHGPCGVLRKFPVFVFFAVFSLSAGCFARSTDAVRVVRVVDGDTVDVDSGATIRYIGIDAPETSRRVASGWVPTGDPDAEEAKKFNEELVLGKVVRLEFDAQAKDKYGRTLAYVFVPSDGKEIFVQVELLRRGLAFLYTFPPNVRYVDVLLRAQEEAQANNAGFWAGRVEIQSSQAADYLNERKFVTGRIKRIRRTDAVIKLEMEGLKVVIFTKDLGFFEKEGIQPAQTYDARLVSVFGLIKSYRGSPEIIVGHPWQIEILD